MNKLLVVLLCLAICGCASAPVVHEPHFFETQDDSTGVIVSCVGNMNAPNIVAHVITIDGKEKIEVGEVSEIKIYLSPGKHNISFVTKAEAFTGAWYLKGKVEDWGKPVEKEINLKENEMIKVSFKPPWGKFMHGAVKVESLEK